MQKRAAHVANGEGVYEFEQHGGSCCRRPLWDAPAVELMQAKETRRRQEFLCSERSDEILINCFAARCLRGSCNQSVLRGKHRVGSQVRGQSDDEEQRGRNGDGENKSPPLNPLVYRFVYYWNF